MKVDLSIPLLLSEIAEATGGVVGAEDKYVDFICTDSRELTKDGVFFAFDKAEIYVKEALSAGAVVSRDPSASIVVDDAGEALLKLAAYYKTRLPHLKKTVAVTGSVGKTCVKDYTAAILSGKYNTHKTSENRNNDIGLPLSILSAPSGTEILVLEMGTNHPGEIRRLSLCAKPDLAIITGIGTSHIGNFGSKKIIANEKSEIREGMTDPNALIIPCGEPLLDGLPCLFKAGNGGDVDFSVIKSNADECVFVCTTPIGSTKEIRFPFGGEHYVKNLAFAVSAAVVLGIDIDGINGSLSECEQFLPRQKRIRVGNATFIDDSYNASLEAYESALSVLSECQGTRSAVVGDVLELGVYSERIHRAIGELCVKSKADKIYPFGKYAHDVAEGAVRAGFNQKNIFINDDPCDHARTAALILENLVSGETVLVKGSHALHTEKIIDCVKEMQGAKNDV